MLPFFTLQNFDLLSVALAMAGIGVLGFSVFFNDRQSATNVNFLLFSIVTIIWSSINYLAYQVINTELSFWLFRLVIFIAVWHAFLFFQTFFIFPRTKVTFPKWYKFILIPLVTIVSVINLTNLVFSKIGEVSPEGKIIKIDNGPGILIFGLLIAFLIVGGLIILFYKMIKAGSEDRKRYSLVLIGVAITFILIIIFNFILPAFFDNPRFIPLGALFIFPFIAFTSYAILRYKLFNIRIAGTAILVFLLSIVSLIEVIRTNDFTLIIYRGFIFLLTLTFGILLIKSVLKEVEQREKIEELNKDLERAYAVEKKAKEYVSRAYEVEKKANDELENLDKVKNQFIAQVQHDLRTPLGIFRDYCDLLLKGTFGKQPKKSSEVIKRIQSLAESKLKEVNTFLDVTQFQLGKGVLSLNPGVDVAPILEEIVAELGHQAESKGIYLEFKKPEETFTINADREKLKAAIFNIVDNSIKYTQEGGVIIKINPKAEVVNNKQDINLKLGTAKLIIIEVQDTGIGIAPEKIKELFEMQFERGEQAKKMSITGKGIGLYLSSHIIKGHKGRVWAESEGEGKGSTFYVELPMDEGKIINNNQSVDSNII